MGARRSPAAVLSAGDRRLLHDLLAVDRMIGDDRPLPAERVEALLGADLARTLLARPAPLSGNRAKAA